MNLKLSPANCKLYSCTSELFFCLQTSIKRLGVAAMFRELHMLSFTLVCYINQYFYAWLVSVSVSVCVCVVSMSVSVSVSMCRIRVSFYVLSNYIVSLIKKFVASGVYQCWCQGNLRIVQLYNIFYLRFICCL